MSTARQPIIVAKQTCLLLLVAATMFITDVAFVFVIRRFQHATLDWSWFQALPSFLAITTLPYCLVVAASAVHFRRFPASHWLLAATIVLVAAASLFYRWADYDIARQAWEARLAGRHFMCCAPPGRFAAFILDYAGVTLMAAVVGVLNLLEYVLARTFVTNRQQRAG